MGRINRKGQRPQDKPISLDELTDGEQSFIKRRSPELFGATPKE